MDGLTIKEVSRLIGRHPATLRRWERRGLIPPSRRDRFSHWRIWAPSEVEAIQKLMAGDGQRQVGAAP